MKRIVIKSLILCLLLGINSCNFSVNVNSEEKTGEGKNISNYLTQSVLWEQTSAEYRALCFQAYNTATLRLKMALDTLPKGNKYAIITDIDETVLDNSPYEAMCIKENKSFDANDWDEWVNKESAEAVPGAIDFLKYAESRGVEVFYISNRLKNQKEATLHNLKKLDLPYADSMHLFLKTNTSAKQPRFKKVKENYKVVLYIGDNCSDFTSRYRATSIKRRFEITDSLQHAFGSRLVVLPNPMYGDWEARAIYKGKHNWTLKQKDSIRKSNLHSYQ